MKSLRKPVLIATGLVLAVTLVVTPKIVGLSLKEATTDNLFALIPPETLQQLEINEADFESGWFGSTAEFDVVYSPLGLNEDFSIKLSFEFSHGPVMWTRNGIAIGLAHASIFPSFDSEELTEAFSSIPFELPDVKINLMAGFDQSLSIAVAVAGVDIEEADTTVNFSGLAGNLRAYSDESAEFALSIGSLSAEQESTGLGFDLKGLQLYSETEKINDLLAPSMAELNIPGLSSEGPIPFTANEILAYSELNISEIDEELIDVQQQFQISELESDMPLTALEWKSEVKELSSVLVRNYYELMLSMQAQMANSSAASPSLDELTQELILGLIRNPLVLNNFIDVTAYQGDHSLDILATWKGNPQISNAGELSIETIIESLELEILMALDLEAVMRSPLAELVDPYAQQGYIRLDNGQVLLELALSNSELVLNGTATSLDQFFPTQSI